MRETINVRGDKDYVVSLTNGTYSVAANFNTKRCLLCCVQLLIIVDFIGLAGLNYLLY